MNKLYRTILILFGLLLAFYPWISNFLYEINAGSQVATYQESSSRMSKTEQEKYFREAGAYNRELIDADVKLTDPFIKEEKKTQEYNKTFQIDETGIMAYVEIPCIGVNLPVYHGTSNEVLEKGIGHLKGTSLPVGGTDTHAVLTGHTGLNSAKMFTDLVDMKKGDFFYLHVLGEVLAYRVDEICVVQPEDTAKLQIVKGKDYVTLVTCTPYGVNSHRLLVRGERTAYDKEIHDAIPVRESSSKWQSAYRNALLIALFLSLILYGIVKFVKRNRK